MNFPFSPHGYSDPVVDSRPAFRVCREEYRKFGSFLVLLVMTHFALCSLLLFSGPDALHHGRYGTVMPRHSCAWLVLLVTTQLALCRSDAYGGFGRIFSIFYVYVDLDPEVDSRRETLDTIPSCVRCFFYVKVGHVS